MTDVAERTPPSVAEQHTSKDAKRRLRARYAAEFRFRAIGIGALLASGFFLVVFLSSIFREGVPAFFQHYLAIDIEVARSDVDPQGTNDPSTIARANFDGLVARSMRALFPEITDRAGQRAVTSVISTGSPVLFRESLLRNLDWIGTKHRYQVPMDDLADLYLKGQITRLETMSTRGELGISSRLGTVQLSSTVNNFQPVLAEIKAHLAATASRTRALAAGQERAAARLEAERSGVQARLPSTQGEERERTQQRLGRIESEIAAARTQLQQYVEQAAALDARARAADQRERLDNTMPSFFVRINGGVIKLTEVQSANAVGTVVIPPTSDAVAPSGAWRLERAALPEASRRLNDTQLIVVETLRERGLVEQRISREFFTGGASREPELAGMWSAIVGSFVTLGITLALCFPVGVAAAIYLEEFAPKNRWTEIIEVNINNLAAVPSIIFGLLGLAVFLNWFGMPRSAPIVGGLVLALMTLPIIIIASRAALKAVPPSIKEAALGIGASHQQAVMHHQLPLAMPGILTGTILGMAHALGETAPLLMIGMVAFVADVPRSITDPATLIPVQIFMWADFPEVAFQQKTAAAIIVLLAFLVVMNAVAVFLRKKFERRW
jgi:phosphate transport system permease protein